jgi:quercetin dioxygenase-like cupin family protein
MHTTRLSLFIGSTVIAGLALAGCVSQKPLQGGGEPFTMEPDHIFITESEVVWKDAPPVLPAGAKIAVLEGDPAKPGPFTLRLQFPAGYRVPPHWHPADEHVTVISGSVAIGMGETFDEAALKELGVGGFAMMRTGTRHFARSKDGAVIQLHGIGPWGLTYVNPADDPRGAAK